MSRFYVKYLVSKVFKSSYYHRVLAPSSDSCSNPFLARKAAAFLPGQLTPSQVISKKTHSIFGTCHAPPLLSWTCHDTFCFVKSIVYIYTYIYMYIMHIGGLVLNFQVFAWVCRPATGNHHAHLESYRYQTFCSAFYGHLLCRVWISRVVLHAAEGVSPLWRWLTPLQRGFRND